MTDPESQRGKIEKFVKLGLIALTAAISYPLAVMALEGLLVWAAVGVTMLVAWAVGPALGEFAANKRIEMLKAAISANPIESMQNLYADKSQELKKQADAITEVDTQYRNVDRLVSNLGNTDPDEAKEYVEIRDKLKEGLNELNDEYQDAASELKSFKGQIDKANRIWTVQKAINKALDVSEKARADVFADIKRQVAFDTVTSNLNRAFARLDTAVQVRKNGAIPKAEQKALDAAKPDLQVVDLGNVSRKQKVS